MLRKDKMISTYVLRVKLTLLGLTQRMALALQRALSTQAPLEILPFRGARDQRIRLNRHFEGKGNN